MFSYKKLTLVVCAIIVQVILGSTVHVLAELCPDEEDILPCVCTSTNITNSLYMDCSGIQGNDQLKQVFAANFRETNFFELTIIGSSEAKVPLDALTDDSFGQVSFERIIVQHTSLATLSTDVFAESKGSLRYLFLNDNKIEEFPFDTLGSYSKLTSLYLQNNNLQTMQDIESTHLQYLALNKNPNLMISENVFKKAQNLIQISMENAGVSNIAPHQFSGQKTIETIDLYNNHLKTLEAYAFTIPSNNVIEIILGNNSIESIHSDAFTDLFCPTDVLLQSNNLATIPELVWKKVFDQQSTCTDRSSFAFDDNPLLCDCSFAWLYDNPDYIQLIDYGAKCENGDDLHALGPDDFAGCK